MSGLPFIGVGFMVGLAAGLAYFALLARTVRQLSAGADTFAVIALYALRAALAIATFLGLAALGWAPLLAGLAGFVVARIVAQRRQRFEP